MCRLVLPLFLFLFLLSQQSALAQEHRCAGQPEVVVLVVDTALAKEVCVAVAQAITFLAQYQLIPKRPIRLNIVAEKIDSHGALAYGSYDSRTDLIQILSFTAILKGAREPEMYGEPFDRVHYSGAIAHEVSHAIFQQHVQTEQISTAPQEYLACSAQLGVLPVARRAQIIRAMDVGPWESGDLISEAYWAMQPGKFAAKSWQHLTALKEPKRFIDILLKANWFYVSVP